MSDTFKRRRRRPSSTRLSPSQLVAAQSFKPARIGMAELVACAGVFLVVVALSALIWMVTIRAEQEQRVEIRDRMEQVLVGQAATLAETISHELQMIDQSLTIVQAAWKADSEKVDLAKWQQQMPALTAVADDLFICDDRHIIQQDILPKAIGQGVGAAYVTFPHGALEQFGVDGTQNREAMLLQAESGAPIEARQFLMYVVRPLDHPKGWLVGASYRSDELTKLFAQAQIGYNSVFGLMDTQRGILQAVAGPASRRPKVDLSKTTLFGLIGRSTAGTWAGETPIDDIERMHAFHRVGTRDMVVLVAASLAEVMAPADTLASGARALASVATILVMAIGGLVLWEFYTIRAHRRQARTLERNRGELERLRTEEIGNTARAKLNAARLAVVLDATTDGVALFDSALRLVQWNHPFLRGIGIEPRKDMPLDTLLREQAGKGLFGPVGDIEAEINRRAGILRTGDTAGVPLPGPGGETFYLRGMPIAEGGFMLLLNGLISWEPAPPPPSTEIGEPTPVEAAPVTAAIDW